MPAVVFFTKPKHVIYRRGIQPARTGRYVVSIRPKRGIRRGSVRSWPFGIYQGSQVIFGHFGTEDIDGRRWDRGLDVIFTENLSQLA